MASPSNGEADISNRPSLNDACGSVAKTAAIAKKANRKNASPKSKRELKTEDGPLVDASGRYSINDFTRDEVCAVIRDVFRDWADVSRDEAIQMTFVGLQLEGLSARRLGSKIRDVIASHLTAAVRRGIAVRSNSVYNLDCQSIADYEKFDLIQYIRSVTGKTWHTRDEATIATARYLGFRRTGKRIRNAIAAAVKSGLRNKQLERDGNNSIRKAP